jgi:hypothetical protein
MKVGAVAGKGSKAPTLFGCLKDEQKFSYLSISKSEDFKYLLGEVIATKVRRCRLHVGLLSE